MIERRQLANAHELACANLDHCNAGGVVKMRDNGFGQWSASYGNWNGAAGIDVACLAAIGRAQKPAARLHHITDAICP